MIFCIYGSCNIPVQAHHKTPYSHFQIMWIGSTGLDPRKLTQQITEFLFKMLLKYQK